MEPVSGRHIALGDGDEARKTRLGGEQIVMVRVKAPIADEIANREQLALRVEEEAEAHRVEHAAEVQLPFLQIKRPECTFVPIALGTSRYEILAALGDAIADSVQALGERVLVIASSDMNHYESDAPIDGLLKSTIAFEKR